jgi:hypothetical protein
MRPVEIVKNKVIVLGLVFNTLELFILSSCGLRLAPSADKSLAAPPKKNEIHNAPKRQCNAAYSRISGFLLVYLRRFQLPDFAI